MSDINKLYTNLSKIFDKTIANKIIKNISKQSKSFNEFNHVVSLLNVSLRKYPKLKKKIKK